MTSQKVTTLHLADIESAIIECNHEDCRARLSIKLGTRKQVPEKCPSCGEPFEVKTRSVLVELLGFYCRPEIRAAKVTLQLHPEDEKIKQ